MIVAVSALPFLSLSVTPFSLNPTFPLVIRLVFVSRIVTLIVIVFPLSAVIFVSWKVIFVLPFVMCSGLLLGVLLEALYFSLPLYTTCIVVVFLIHPAGTL